jgi:hypothetical protein
MMDAGIKTTAANDKIIACVQADPADPTILSCAQTVGTPAQMAGSGVQTTFKADTPKSACDGGSGGSFGFYDTLITAKSDEPSFWSDRKCNGSLDYRDGTLGCYGQYFRSTVVDYVWTIWQW